MEDLSQRQAVWSRYWQTGAAHSCGTSYGERYGGAIAAFWQQVSGDTPEGSRLLDVATGSGAVPRLWRHWRTTDHWDAVDLSTTPPAWLQDAGDGVHFHGEVRAEALPFPPASFDLVTSQYGIEYADMQRAVPEVLRVLAPTGGVALVLHHRDARPVTLARTELAHLDWALGTDGLVPACADMLGPAAAASTAEGRERLARDPAAEAARLRFNAAQTALRERTVTQDGADTLVEIRDAVGALIRLAMQRGESQARAGLARWQVALADHRWRLAELCTCALDPAAAQALAARFEQAGRRTTLGSLVDGAHLMGWTLRATVP